jgi:hypothetical protein
MSNRRGLERELVIIVDCKGRTLTMAMTWESKTKSRLSKILGKFGVTCIFPHSLLFLLFCSSIVVQDRLLQGPTKNDSLTQNSEFEGLLRESR